MDTQLQDQLMALNEIFIRGVEMMRQVQEESFAIVQCMVEESTHQVVKKIVFDDEYESLEEIEEKVQEFWEVKEAYEAIDLSSSIELIYIYISNRLLCPIPTIIILYHL